MFLKILDEGSNFGYNNMLNVEPTNNGYDGEAGAYQIIAESNEEWGNIAMAMANAEAIALMEGNGLLLEGAMRGFFEKVKDFFIKMWQKVEELFKRFITWISSRFRSDESFIKKYKGKLSGITGLINSDFKFKMVPFTGDRITSIGIEGTIKSTEMMDELISQMNVAPHGAKPDNIDTSSLNDKLETEKGKMRGFFTGQSSTDASDFKEEVYKAMCDGEDPTPTEIKPNATILNDMIITVEYGKKAIQKIQKMREQVKKLYNSIIKQMQNLAKKYGSADINKDFSFKQIKHIDARAKFREKNPDHVDAGSSSQLLLTGDVNNTANRSYNGEELDDDAKMKQKSNTSAGMETIISLAKALASITNEGIGFTIGALKKHKSQCRANLSRILSATANGQMRESIDTNNILDMFM